MGKDEVMVYAGAGSSHSWTWLADLFDSIGMVNARFLDSDGFVEALTHRPRIAIISGGDGFAIARSLQGEGFARLKDFISKGGKFAGVCAGAYLPLPSSVEPFSQFNLSSTKIENINCRLTALDGLPPRAAVSYGDCAVVHPIRGEIDIDIDGHVLKAPIYGGPIFREPDEDRVLLRYRGFTPNTEFQFGIRVATDVMVGRPAAVRCMCGNGELLLFGPHLEHPSYPDANRVFMSLIGLSASNTSNVESNLRESRMSGALADLKVAVLGLENRSFVVGKKLWDGSRYMELIDAIEKRAGSAGGDLANDISRDLERVRRDIVRLNCRSGERCGPNDPALGGLRQTMCGPSLLPARR